MPKAGDQPWRVGTDGVILRVRVTPKSSHDGVEGVEDTADGTAFKVRVRAAPEDGAANAAVAAAVAGWLGLAKRSVTLHAGGRSRVKTLAIVGNAGELDAMLLKKLAEVHREKDD